MYEVKFTTAFKKSYKLMKKRGFDMDALDSVIDTLRQGQALDDKYRDLWLTQEHIPIYSRNSAKMKAVLSGIAFLSVSDNDMDLIMTAAAQAHEIIP